MSRRQKAINRKRPKRQTDNTPFYVVGGVLVALVFGFQMTPGNRQFRAMKSEVNSLNDRTQFEAKRLKAESEARTLAAEAEIAAREAEAQLAHQRYYAQCVVTFVAPAKGEQYASKVVAITNGFKPIDQNTGQPFPPGKEICDDRGTTAEVGKDGYVDMDTVAYATSSDVINTRFENAAHWNPDAHRSEIVGSNEPQSSMVRDSQIADSEVN